MGVFLKNLSENCRYYLLSSGSKFYSQDDLKHVQNLEELIVHLGLGVSSYPPFATEEDTLSLCDIDSKIVNLVCDSLANLEGKSPEEIYRNQKIEMDKISGIFEQLCLNLEYKNALTKDIILKISTTREHIKNLKSQIDIFLIQIHLEDVMVKIKKYKKSEIEEIKKELIRIEKDFQDIKIQSLIKTIRGYISEFNENQRRVAESMRILKSKLTFKVAGILFPDPEIEYRDIAPDSIISLPSVGSRLIFIVNNRPYYISTGINSSQADTVFPFRGMANLPRSPSWFVKPKIVSEFSICTNDNVLNFIAGVVQLNGQKPINGFFKDILQNVLSYLNEFHKNSFEYEYFANIMSDRPVFYFHSRVREYGIINILYRLPWNWREAF